MTTGHEAALAAIRERIVGYATSRVGRDVAEDLAQEALLVLEAKYAGLEKIEDLLPVAVTIMQFQIKNHVRGAWHRVSRTAASLEDVPVQDAEPGPDSNAQYAELKRSLLEAIGRLGDRCRRLFLLKLDGYTFEEIRARMDANTIDTVYTWDFRCRRELRNLTGGWLGRS